MEKTIHTESYRRLLRLLREAREAAGLRQADVADRLGVPQSFVSKYEVGERRLDLVELQEISEALGKPLEKLVKEWQSG